MNVPDSEAGGEKKVLAVEAAAAGLRLDQWLVGKLAPEFSRSRIQSLIRDGAVSLAGKTAVEPKRKVAPGDVVAVYIPEPEPAEPEGEAIPLDILFEDDELIVIDKAAGLVVHPGPGNWTGTLVNALIAHCGDTLSGIGGVKRPGIVHRLDKETSGVMVVAKTDHAHRELAAAFADHGRTGDLERAYIAVVWGAPRYPSGTIDAPLGRSSKDRMLRAVVREEHSDARHAVTHYKVLERFGPIGTEPLASVVECRLETGRTHQIRVHMAHAGRPLVGDKDYGRAFRSKANRLPEPARTVVETFPRQALHARLLAFRHPTTHMLMRFEAPLPNDIRTLVEALRAKA